jgi:adenine-specific DNA methylase
MLFDTPSYFNHSFPAPQYLGAKHTHLAWINKFILSRITTALDAFAGSQSMAFLFKQLGFKTITNDFLNFNHQIGLALIENNNIQLSNDDVNLLFSPAINKTNFQLIEKLEGKIVKRYFQHLSYFC